MIEDSVHRPEINQIYRISQSIELQITFFPILDKLGYNKLFLVTNDIPSLYIFFISHATYPTIFLSKLVFIDNII